ncbi:MAG: PQQ-binding-like beta-propeller repeat protein [Phycisphaerales bacterium]
MPIALLACVAVVLGQALVMPGQPSQNVQQPVYIEDSPAAQDLAEEALELRDQGRLADAAQKLQRVIEEYPHKLMLVSESSYTDALLWVRGKLLDDAELLRAYRSLYGPAAEREVNQAMPTADRALDVEALREVLARYTLTHAGLDAGLALGAYHLERAEGGDALGVLDELSNHPDLPDKAGRYHLMRSVACLLIGDLAGAAEHEHALRELPDSQYRAEFEALTNRIHPPFRLNGANTGGAPVVSSLPESLDTPLWDIDLLEGLWQGFGNRPDLRNAQIDQVVLRVIPAVNRASVLVNSGVVVTAYDRASGWRLWERPDKPGAQTESAGVYPGRGLLIEPRGVYVSGERAYALLGWLNPNQNVQAGLEGGVSLIAMDAGTGEEFWRVTPDELDPALSKAAFDGTPCGEGGRIYTLAKRVQVSGLHDLYLTAVRESDGGLLWRRHLSSSSVQAHYNAGPSARMSLHAGRVYVCDNLGTVYSLDGRTGTVRWVTMLPDAGEANPTVRRNVAGFKDLPEPVRVAAGLLVPSVAPDGPYLLLDSDTGVIVSELSGGDWDTVDACYPAGANVLGVGAGVTYFDGQTLEPLWHRALDDERDGRVRGRPAIDPGMVTDPVAQAAGRDTTGALVITTDHRLLALKLDDGRVLTDHAIDAPGNVLLAPGQVVVASPIALNSYTDWHIAHGQLKERAEGDPSSPQPGMAMARLAMRTGRDPAVLEGIDLALAAVEHPALRPGQEDTRQAEAFGLLREFSDPAGGASVPLRGALLDRMAVSASGPTQEAAYQMTRAQYLEETGQLDPAVEHYQAVLADPSLSAELYTIGRGSRRAGLEARRMLKALIDKHGREFYQPFDLLAEHEYNELQSRSASDAQAYTELADRYPLALSVNKVRSRAAELYLDAGETASAVRQWQAVYLNTESENDLSSVVGRIVDVYLSADRTELAKRWLRRVEREHPGLVIVQDDQPVSVQAWLSELQHLLAGAEVLPRLDLPLAEPRWVDGVPVPMESGDPANLPSRDRVLMHDGQSIWMLAGPGLEELWRKPTPAGDVRVLAMDDQQVVWWSKQAGRIGAMDSRSGESLWPDLDITKELEETGNPQQREEQRTRQQREFVNLIGGGVIRNPMLRDAASLDTLMSAIDLTTLMFADRLGRAVCIDRQTGQVRWRTLSPSDSMTALALGDGLVALGGASWADTEAQHGVVTLLDTLSGEPIETLIQSDEIATWLGFTENGLLVTAASNKITAYDPATGRTEWRSDVPRSAGPTQVWLGDRLLIYLNQQGDVGSAVVLDVLSGETVNQLPIRKASGQALMLDTVLAEGHGYIMTPMRSVGLDASGRLLWSDAICAPIGHLAMQFVGRQYVCLIGGASPSQALVLPQINFQGHPELEQALREAIAAGQLRTNGGYRLYLLDRTTGSIVSDTPLNGLGPIGSGSAAWIDGALLIGSGGRTLVVGSESAAD